MKVDQEDMQQFVKSPAAVKSFETDPQVFSPSESKTSPRSSFSYDSSPFNHKLKNPTRKSSNGYVYRIREHVRMGTTFTETVKGKLSLGAKIVKAGGRENIFKQIFGMEEEEKLLKASQCYLFTTAGPIAGILFVSTLKVAFCSERSIPVPAAFSSQSSAGTGTPYKVVIPIRKIKRGNESENVNKPAEKYIEIVTEDDYEFWFMGFVRFEKALFNLHKAISMSTTV
ncbi:putative GEM-like protein 8 [Impatiens glandulifera]|uniref:putative GEM-like protein 8 n=1 Tax=Impatiens glandulifera TaxID=253017 RepID=UPI001FB12398|nr:putative GEM-like protein 8 [Impatiens glandulifera]